MSTTKRTIPFTAHHAIYETTLSFAEVQSRLYAEVNKENSDGVLNILRSIKSQKDFESVVAKYKGQDFLYFAEIHHHVLLQYSDGLKHPSNVVYTIGNPLIAQRILKHNTYAAYNIPPRLLITEKPDFSGCVVYFQPPSATMGVPFGETEPELQRELEALDAKLDNLVTKITTV
ncbi:hypothetical protein CPC08DRAFT_813214 [Agrocybe pediades]|nr:hypothetical protein CPC08DRAFT_813214 [Agrocybe pediades]